jgi:hypothetical protein
MAGEWDDSTTIDVVKIGGALAALSVLTVFLDSFASVMYARGLFSELGFPASAVNVKVGADIFGVVAYGRCFLLVAVGIAGFIPVTWSIIPDKTHERILLTILFVAFIIIGVSVETMSQSPLIRLPMGALASILPLLIGYTFRSTQRTLTQYPKVMVVCVAALLVFGFNLRLTGAGQAMKVISAELDHAKAPIEGSFAKRPKDFSVITLVSKEIVSFLTGGRKLEDGYEYAPQPGAFLRFVAQDESNYFLIEKKGSVITPFTARKDSVTSMMFEPDSGVPPNP